VGAVVYRFSRGFGLGLVQELATFCFVAVYSSMSRAYKTYEGGLFLVTLTVVGWIDVFTRREYDDTLIKNLKYCQEKKGLLLYGYCIMSSHLHLIAAAKTGILSHILRDFKSYTAKQLIKQITENTQESRKDWLLFLFKHFAKNTPNTKIQFWQQHNHPSI
jgi:REP element-mobilizing transposase RayT